MTIYQTIQSVADVGSTKEKQSILTLQSDETLALVFFYTENPRFNYFMKLVETEFSELPEGNEDITSTTFNGLDKIVSREVTGHAAKSFVVQLMMPLTKEARIILSRIINKDLRCGAGTSIANKVWKDLIPEYPCLLCGKFDAKSEKYLKQFENKVGYIIQKKSDGGRLIIKVDTDKNVTYHSRNGNELNLYGCFDHQFREWPNSVFDGELIVKTIDGKPDRKTGNGLYTKAVRGTLTEQEAKKFSIELWDIIPASEYNTIGTMGYDYRFKLLQMIGFTGNVELIRSKHVQTLAECIEFYNEMRSDGQEGAVIKVANAVWEDARSKNYIKLKAAETADLLCIGVEEGTGKYAGMIGALICQTSDGKLLVGVGTGLKDSDRAKSPMEFIGKIVEIKYNEVITSKDKTTSSLFLPVYVKIRFDKIVVNSLSELK